MGVRNLFGLCLAFFSFSALSAIRDAPIKIGDTTYYQVESGVKLKGGQLAEHNRNTMKLIPMEREIYQRQTSKIVVDAHKVSAPVEVESRWSAVKVQGALKKGLKVGISSKFTKATVASFLASAALDKLLTDAGFFFDEKTDELLKSGDSPLPSNLKVFDSYDSSFIKDEGLSRSNATPPGAPIKLNPGYHLVHFVVRASDNWNSYSSCSSKNFAGIIYLDHYLPHCLYYKTGDSVFVPEFDSKRVTLSDVDSLNPSNFKPDENSITFLSNYLGTPDEIRFSNISEFQGESKTFTYTDENGETITKQVNTWHNFSVSPSTVTSSSGDPKLEVSTKTQTDTYKDGQKTSSKTETETTKPSNNSEDKPVAGGGGAKIDIPTDCEFMPTVCAFLDWFKKDDPPDDPDLSALIDNRDFTETYSITGGSKQCPADYEFTVDFIGRTYSLSFEPACDFASKMYYFVMAAAYIFAAYITIGASRNG